MSDADLIQRSDDWLKARCGSLGASSVHEALARTKSGPAASRANLRARLIVERLTGKAIETYQNAAMLTGIEREPEARAAYAFDRDVDVSEVGLIRHPSIAWTHASPDGLVSNEGLLEIKAPQPAAHLDLLLGAPIPEKYVLQCMWQMACSGRAWADFASYNPDFPERMRLYVKRIDRDDKAITVMEREVALFLAEVDSALAQLERIAA